MRYENGTPREIDDLDLEPALNRPWDSDLRSWTGLTEHIRAQAAFIAQLHARLRVLEENPAHLAERVGFEPTSRENP